MQLDSRLIGGFSETYLKAQYDEPVETPDCHYEWWDLVCQSYKYVAIAAPREHAKSTAITHAFVLATVCFRIKSHVLIVSDTEAQATSFLGDISKEFTENESLIQDFGIDGLEKDREDEIIVRFKPDAEGRIHRARLIARGSCQKLRGIKWRNKRPDLIIGDDLENDELTANEERRYKFRSWFYKALLPCGSKSTWVRIVGTILHEDSMLNRLMPKESDPETICDNGGLRLRTLKKRAWKTYLYRAHPDYDDFGAILWIEQHPEERLRSTRAVYEEDGNPEGYSQEYLNRATTEAVAFIKRIWFSPISADTKVNPPPEEFFVGVDMAISERKQRAKTAFVTAGLDHKNVLRFWDVIREQMDSLDIVRTFFELDTLLTSRSATQTQPVFIVEDENISKAIGPFLDEEMEERNHFLSIIKENPGTQDKRLRARPLQARMRKGGCEYDYEAEWFPAYQEELVTFPFSSSCDQLDASAWLGRHLNQMGNTPTPRELLDEQYYEEMDDAEYERGNPYTGY